MAVERRKGEENDLNLVPIMNLVSILIPFLLMSAEFVQLAVIDSTLPAIGPPSTEPPDPSEKPPLNLSLVITGRGITVMGANAVLEANGVAVPAEGEERKPTVGCKSGEYCTDVDDYEWPELTRILGMIKDEYPDDENVILVPDSKIKYEIIVKTMDSSREDRENPDADGSARILFPFVVIAGGAM